MTKPAKQLEATSQQHSLPTQSTTLADDVGEGPCRKYRC